MLLNAPVNDAEVQNPIAEYPNISIKDLLGQVRLDQSKGELLLTEKILLAMDTINGDLKAIDIQSEEQIRKYKRAVSYEAAALICEDNLDFDTTTTGQSRGENQKDKADSLRRIVQHTIADLTNRPRNRVRLI
ncbi:head completion/stabilization protein [Acinetobacter sp. NIPH 1852]|uniref:head completion/stabilization protein n=1 Tax=Acinetobacter sp. NIPH 1852 TaxID=2923428 RepID=UPI001F4B5B8D|nr:head completion/stabilization protein [Acinetobacter sp. NIPH 1852]MCH7306620.1 head completion/stabilization protein [Acinetobacter sp. NIPH 1852]